MSSGVAPPRQPAGIPPEQRSAECDRFIEDRLEKTRRQVKTVDAATRLAALLVGVLVYLLAATLIDHWVVARGLGFFGRLALWIGLVAGVSLYAAWYVVPLVIYRINPIFAAYTIEQSRPSFKNSLINFLFLRRRREEIEKDELAGHFYHGLEYRTAAELSQVSVEAAVDRTHLLRLAYALAALVVFCCAYLLISPKNPLVSFQRVMWPWARVGAPTRVSIDAVEPGDAVAYQGENVVVSADVRGLKDGEPVLVYFTTADGQCVDQAIPMSVPEGERRWRCEVPPGSLGIQQDLVYYLSAGDCIAPKSPEVFRIQMQIPLSIVVDSVQYKYPEYTGLAPRTVEKEGDLRGLEGTRVTLRATANQPIARAMVEFDGDARKTLSMEARGSTAATQFILQMSRDDPSRPQYGSYQLRFTDPERRENRRPIRHRVEVIPDLKPEVRFVDRPPDEARVPESGSLPLKVRAEDPDFGLRRVTLRAEKEGRGLAIAPLLGKPKPEKAHPGPFEQAYRFEPAKLGLKAGDRVLYWAEALDNKEDARGPAPNTAETDKQWLVIVSDDQPRQPPPKEPQTDKGQSQPKRRPDSAAKPENKPTEDQRPGDDRGQQDSVDKPGAAPGDKEQPKQPPDKQPGKKSDQQQNDPSGGRAAKTQPQPSADQGRQDSAGPSEQDQQPVNPETDPAEAMKRILQYRKEKQKQEQPAGQQPQDQQPGDQQPGEPKPDVKQPGEQEPGKQQPGEAKPGESQPPPEQAAPPKPKEQDQPRGPKPGDGQEAVKEPSDRPQDQGSDAREKQPPPSGAKGGSQPDRGPADPKEPAGQQDTGKPKRPGQPGEGNATEKPTPDPSNASGSPEAKPPQSPSSGPPSGAPKDATAKSGKGQGERAGTATGDEREKPKPSDGARDKPEATGGNPESVPGEPSAGLPQAQPKPAPVSEGPKTQRPKQPGDEMPPKEATGPQEPPSPVTSPKASNAKSDDTPGDRPASGGAGAGQQAKQPGTGKSGTNTASDQGGGLSQEPGKDSAGSKAGEGPKAGQPTGESARDKGGRGAPKGPADAAPTGEQIKDAPPEPDAAKGMQNQDQPPPAKPGPGGEGQPGTGSAGKAGPSDQAKGPAGGVRSGGGLPPDPNQPKVPPPAPPPALPPDDPNLDYARRQINLTLQTLEEELAKPKSELFEREGWKQSDAEKFLRQWEAMFKAAKEQGPRGDQARRDLQKALRSLGLKPRGTQLRDKATTADALQQQDAGRFAPPAEWAEWYEAYTKGVAGGKP